MFRSGELFGFSSVDRSTVGTRTEDVSMTSGAGHEAATEEAAKGEAAEPAEKA